MAPPHRPDGAPAVVIDTNAVLDWQVFRDPGMAALAAAVEAGTVRWLACPAMRAELARTVNRTALARWAPDAVGVLATFDLRAVDHPPPPPAPPSCRCTDPDDQVFIDLALAGGARWLVTHDRALLKLARPARERGVAIVRPADWQLA